MPAFGTKIDPAQIVIVRGGTSKHDAIDALVTAVARNAAVTDAETFRKAVHEREAVMSTGIGGGIAIPHVRIPEVKTTTLGVGIAPKGIDFAALDNNPVYVLVLFATPEGANKEYLGMLAQVMAALRDHSLFERLVACRSAVDAEHVLND